MNHVRDISLRAAKTFLQAFLATWALTGNGITKNALIGAMAAGISAIMNASSKALQQKLQ